MSNLKQPNGTAGHGGVVGREVWVALEEVIGRIEDYDIDTSDADRPTLACRAPRCELRTLIGVVLLRMDDFTLRPLDATALAPHGLIRGILSA